VLKSHLELLVLVLVFSQLVLVPQVLEQTQIEKLQAQISTIKGQILMIQQAGINPIEKGVK
jgi:hypothetical protein